MTRLADATLRALETHTSLRGPVGLLGDLDRRGRVRTMELRRKLARRGVTAIDLSPRHPPRHDRAAHVLDDAVVLIVDVAAQHALATQFAVTHGLPLVALRPDHEATRAEQTHRGVISLRTTRLGDQIDDIALSEVEVRPESPDVCRLAVRLTHGRRVWTRRLPPGTLLRVTPRPDALAVEAELLPAGDHWRRHGQTITVTPEWGGHTITRDGVPIADLQAPLSLTPHDNLELHIA